MVKSHRNPRRRPKRRNSKHLKTKFNLDNQWLMAWVAYRAGHYDEAIDRFRDLTGKRKLRKYKAAYWLARALMRSGQVDPARAANRNAVVAERLQKFTERHLRDLAKLYRVDLGGDRWRAVTREEAVRAMPELRRRWDGFVV